MVNLFSPPEHRKRRQTVRLLPITLAARRISRRWNMPLPTAAILAALLLAVGLQP